MQLRDSLARVCRLVPGADDISAALLASPTTSANADSDSNHGVTSSGGFHQNGSGGYHQSGGSGGPLKYAAFDGDRVSVEMSSM